VNTGEVMVEERVAPLVWAERGLAVVFGLVVAVASALAVYTPPALSELPMVAGLPSWLRFVAVPGMVLSLAGSKSMHDPNLVLMGLLNWAIYAGGLYGLMRWRRMQ
jgi:hypothetical protein